MFRHVLCVVSLVLVAGCATEQTLTVNTVPQGAIITQFANGMRNQTPAQLTYALTEEHRDKPSGCYRVSGFSVQWPSGAQARSDQIVRLCGPGSSWVMSVKRPADVANLDIDIATERAVLASLRAAEQEQKAAGRDAIFNILGHAAAGAAEGWAASKDNRRAASSSDAPVARKKAITCRPSLVKDPFSGQPSSYTCD